jgi:trigger factor
MSDTKTKKHEHNINWKEAFTVEELPDSRVKISGELPYAELASERNAAIVELGKNVELDGFRKGHIPTPVLEKHLGEMTILTKMSERAIAHAYPHILAELQIDAIGQPQIEITKIAPENPLGFTVTVSVVPKFKLPDYEAIAKEVNLAKPSDEVSDEELEEKIKEIQKSKRAYDKMQELSKAQAESEAKGEDADQKKQSMEEIQAKVDADNEAPLPELTDEYVKTLGQPGQFETVEDFKQKLREHLEIEKKQQVAAKHRADITDAIIAKTDITLPQILIDTELNQMFAQMEDDLKRSNLKMEDYLTHIKKTKEDLAAEWKPAAETRAKLQLILNEIAKDKEIIPDPKEVEAQTAQLKEKFKDADEHRVRLYVASMLQNEAVMKHLETI